MAKYYPVWPKFWRGERRAWTDQEKLLALYLLTCEHRNLEGLYYLPKPYIAADLNWSPRTVDRTLDTLIAAGFCKYDPDAQVVLVPRALAHQAPRTAKQLTGAVRSLDAVPATSLRDDFMTVCAEFAPSLADAIRNGIGDPIGNAIANPSGPDPDGFAHARTHTSISNSTSKTPRPPEGGVARENGSRKGNGKRPRRPFGGRKRDWDRYEQDEREWSPCRGDDLGEFTALWPVVVRELRAAVDDGAFTWLALLHPHGVVDDALVLGGRSAPVMQERYGQLIAAAVAHAGIDARRVEFVECEHEPALLKEAA